MAGEEIYNEGEMKLFEVTTNDLIDEIGRRCTKFAVIAYKDEGDGMKAGCGYWYDYKGTYGDILIALEELKFKIQLERLKTQINDL